MAVTTRTKSAEEICGDVIACERSTVFRQKSKLVQRMSVFLFGVDA
jgi:hypothetical protein